MQIDAIWLGVMFSTEVGISGITPPFGVILFVLKGYEVRHRLGLVGRSGVAAGGCGAFTRS